MAKKEPICPLLKKACLAHDCAWYGHMEGMNPQTGAVMDHWDCSIKWLPILITEQARQTRGVQASVESFRNESVQRQDEMNSGLKGVGQFVQLIDAVSRSALPPATHVDKLTHEG